VVGGTLAAASTVVRGVLGLPFGILRAVTKGATKAAGETVTKHIRKN
jgi:hypothetical protein